MNRRAFLQVLSVAAAAGALPSCGRVGAVRCNDLYDIAPFGDVRLLHITDTHAQLEPVYYREPDRNVTVDRKGKAGMFSARRFLRRYGIPEGSRSAYALTALDFVDAAYRYGAVGGYAHLATLVRRLRAEAGPERCLLLDGGDSWQGSGTALWLNGEDMVEASNLLGVDCMTGHWEFTYGEAALRRHLHKFSGEFLAHNVRLTEEAEFEGKSAFDDQSGHVFQPYTIKRLGEARVAVIGQAYPYTPVAHPRRLVSDWRFGIEEEALQELVDRIKATERPEMVVLLSHNGFDVDLKLAERVSGIDAILGGHTHDAIPAPRVVTNRRGHTLVTNAGSNGKFVGVLDCRVGGGKLREYRYHLLPVFANLIPVDSRMEAYIGQIRGPFLARLHESCVRTERLLYRRGNFNGPFDQLICNALRDVLGAEIALSPGFRWGTSLLPGEVVRFEDILNQTAITYPNTYVRQMTGRQIKAVLEDVCDNLFNPDPYYRQGGDMVRVGGLDYVCNPAANPGRRISDLTLDKGKGLDADRTYSVAGWAAVGEIADGPPVWDVVREYLGGRDTLRLTKINSPRLKGVAVPGDV